MPKSQPRTRPPLALFLVPALAAVAVFPLIRSGCSCGHDFDFHILSWLEAAAQFRAGNLHPSWAFSPAFNAGEPRFVFYPPLSWTLGAVLGLTIPWAAVPIIYTWIALTASGAAMYRLARQFSGRNAALIATAIYIANPYMLFTAYERTAYAELLAAAWLPLLLAAALTERVTILRLAVPVALLWLTNAPAAVMGCYALALIALVRCIEAALTGNNISRRAALNDCANLALRFAAGAALGIALAAFYIVPAVYERSWVQIAMATISGMKITDNFLFHHTSDAIHDAVLHTASDIALILLASSAVPFAAAIVRTRKSRETLVLLAVLTAAIALMLTPLSAPIWRIAPEMQFLQFPWRLLAVLAPAVCAAISIAIEHSGRHADENPISPSLRRPLARGWGVAITAASLVAAFTFPSVSIFRQPCDDEDTVAARLALFNAKTGTDPTDEYTPADADNDALAHSDPAFWLAEDPDAAGRDPDTAGRDPDTAAQTTSSPGLVPMHFAITVPKDEMLILNLRHYPAWQVRLNGRLAKHDAARADGLIAVPVPRGSILVDIAYAPGRDHTLGDAISLSAGAAALALGSLKRRGHAHRRVSS